MSIDIRVVTSPHETRAIHQQRYAIYVEELGYPQAFACHQSRTVVEPMDACGVLFGAFKDERLIASVRVNYGCDTKGDDEDGRLGDFIGLYGLRRFGPWFPAAISVVTKLMIEPQYRAGTLMARLGVALYAHTRDTRPSIMFCVIDCVPDLRDYFLRLGYRQIGPRFRHPAAGMVVPMAFPVYDRRHFESVGSPLARACPRHDEVTATWFQNHLSYRQATGEPTKLATHA